MAAIAAVAVNTDEDEKYLYGDNTNVKTDNNDEIEQSLKEKKEDFDNDEDGEFEESDDDDDDDNIQVHIGEVNTTTGSYGTPGAWKKEAGKTGGTAVSATIPAGQKKIDVNAVGLINGQPIYEFDIDTEIDEKPWRKPGSDLSDYFNYGFTEDTWKQYCEKQRRMRLESNRGPYTVTQTVVPATPVEIEVLPDGRTRVKAGPPPDRKVEGSIHVLGSDADVRRKQKEDELLALALGQQHVIAPTSVLSGQTQMYTALPNGTLVYNPVSSQTILPTSSSQGETNGIDQPPLSTSQVQQPGQQIQTIGAPTMMNTVMPGGLQYLPQGMRPPMQQGHQMFPPPQGMEMQFAPPDPFVHPGMPPPGFGAPYGGLGDEDFDSDGENRRHRSRRSDGSSSRHRRHRDRGDRDSRNDRDRDRSRRDRDRSESRSRRDHSKSSSDRKKHSSRSSSIKTEDDEAERKSRSSRRSSKHTSESQSSNAGERDKQEQQPADVKQETSAE